ncbi:MAG TPA: biopolymer transporter ExbD, partial [Candidatus Polarisedimenticolia bacterium]|nr:biopolymer transporter ExbD [Candidatus Polarisedimenticolia bacterium]
AAMQAGDSKNLNSDINVTPFVDICLVLLVIFMVVTPMLQEGITVHLPYAKHTEKHEDDEAHAIVVAVPNDKQIYIQKKPVPRDQFQAEMTEIHDRMPDKAVLIKADKGMKYGDVRKVMVETNEAGFEEVSLVTEKAPGAEG